LLGAAIGAAQPCVNTAERLSTTDLRESMIPTASDTAPAVAQPFILRIPASPATGRLATRCAVASLDEAVGLYEAARDESGEGASTFAAGEVTGPNGERYCISYNGRLKPMVRP
jgi:hypothetical protein